MLDIKTEKIEFKEQEKDKKKVFCGIMILKYPKKYMNRYNNDWRVA